MKSYKSGALDSIRAELKRRNEAAGFVMEGAMKRKIREYGLIDTGRMITSVTHDSDEDGAIAGTNVKEYPLYMALGTRYFTPPGNWAIDGIIEEIPTLRKIYGGDIS